MALLILLIPLFFRQKEDSSTFEKKTVSNISNDPMTCPLYNATQSEYRLPTDGEMALLHKAYLSAVGFHFRWPLVIVRCTEPPENVPLTIGSVPATFLAVDDTYDPDSGHPREPACSRLPG
jgi:hypothetical protein